MLKLILIALLSFAGAIKSRGQDNAETIRAAVEKERSNSGQRAESEKERARADKDRTKTEKERAKRDRSNRDGAYGKARALIEAGQWEDALTALDEARNDAERADASLYWKGYAQNKLGRGADALATLATLAKEFPQSRWIEDSKALESDIRQSTGQKPDPESQADEELKLMALNSLMHTDTQKALPMLKKLLETNQPPKIKERALFVLSQSNSREARQIVADFARGKTNPELQMKSLEYLGMMGGSASRETLSEVYSATTDKKIKRFILHAFMMGGDRDRLVTAAKSEQDADLRMEAINQLGMLRGKDVLSDLYANESDAKVKRRILDALFMSGATDRLMELAEKEKDPQLRRSAIEKLGLSGPKTAEALVKLYSEDTDKDIRKRIIEALFLQGNAKAIVSIARSEKDPEMRKKAVEQLSIMNSKEGAAYFEEILSK